MIPTGWLPALLGALVAASIVWVAVPTGSAGAGGQFVARLAAFASLGLAAAVYDGRPPVRRIAVPLAALAALAGLALAQSAVWPVALARRLSPRHVEVADQARELLSAAGPGVAGGHGVALSLAPQLSRSAALAILAAAAFFFGAFVAAARRRRRRWLMAALVGGGLFQVVYGLREWLAGAAPRLRGTFFSPNHLAYALEIALVVTFAWAVWSVHAQRSAARLERRLLLVAPPLAAWLVLAAGLLWTGSRAGLAAAGTGLLLQGLLLASAVPDLGRGRVRGWVPGALAAAATALLALLALRGAGRLAETTLYEVAWGARAAVWRASLELWLRFPVTGTGLGTFGEAFPMVQPAETTDLFWRRAHNDPLELLVTGGLVGVALGGAILFGVVRALVRVLRSGSRTEDRAAALAALGGLASVSVHELMDFGLTLPAIGLPFFALLGAAAAAPVRKRSGAARPVPGEAAGERRARPPDGGARSA